MEKQYSSPFSLSGKTILISGASSGIGRQGAIEVANSGGRTVLLGRDVSRLEETISNLNGEGHIFYSYDLNDIGGIQALVKQLVEDNGMFDGFVHSAGVEITSPFKYTQVSDYESLYRINCLSAFEIIRHLNTIHSFSDGGSLVLIASISGVIGRKGLSAYSASKGALISAVRTMALEFSKRKIRVNAVSPGTILTPMMRAALDEMPEDVRERRLSGFPLGLGTVEDVANGCLFLLSDASRWVTGQNLIIDGGYTSI